MSESTEVRVARLEEQFKFVIQEAIEARASRKTQYETNETMRALLAQLTSSITKVEDKLAVQSPTIEEFITIKHKVVGAGKLGKWVWLVLGGAITLLYNSRGAIISWLTKV